MSPSMESMTLLGGSANPDLTAAVAGELGVPPCPRVAERFPDGEVSIRLQETVRQKHVFILQSTAPPVDENLVELLALADACRRDSAARITAIIPYFGYARSDLRHGNREPISASMVAKLLQAVGIQHVVTVDLHTPQIEGFFHIPIDNLSAVQMLSEVIRPRLPRETVVISPDSGRVAMASRYAELLATSLVVLHKQRLSGTETRVVRLIGDVRKRTCLIVDDMISTGETIARTVEALLEAGANEEFYVAATHGLFVRDARRKLGLSAVRQVFTTNTVARPAQTWTTLEVFSVAALVAATIRRSLFQR